MRSTLTPYRTSPFLQAGMLLSLTTVLAFGLACGGDDSGTETATSVTPQIEIPVQQDEPAVAVELGSGTLPPGYPADLPAFPGAATKTSMMIPGGTGLVVFSASEPVEDVLAFFSEQLPVSGWSVDSTSEDGKRIHASKDTRNVTVVVDQVTDHTEISVVLGG